MIDLEERLDAVFDNAADGLNLAPAQPGRPQTLARRRRRKRRLAAAAMAAIVVFGLGALSSLLTGRAGVTDTADDNDVDWRRVTGPVDLDLGSGADVPGAGFVQDLFWSDGYYIAHVYDNGIARSTDGEQWEVMSDRLPGGFQIDRLTADDERLILWGRPDAADEATVILASDDHAATWAEVGQPVPPAVEADLADLIQVTTRVTTVVSRGDTYLATVARTLDVDPAELVRRGLLEPDGPSWAHLSWNTIDDDTVELRICSVPMRQGRCNDGELTTEIVPTPWPYDEEQVYVLRSDGGRPFEIVAEPDPDFRPRSVVATGDRFIALLGGADDGRFVRGALAASDDGAAWEPVGLDGYDDGWVIALDAHGSRVAVAIEGDGDGTVLSSTDGGRSWVAAASGAADPSLSVGPDGVAFAGADQRSRSMLHGLIGLLTPGPSEFPHQLGWSADGGRWLRWTAERSFDVPVANDTFVDVVVADGRLLAEVTTYETTDGGRISGSGSGAVDPEVRYYVADLPGS